MCADMYTSEVYISAHLSTFWYNKFMRREVGLANGEIYHLINRGILRNIIFSHQNDYYRFFNLLNYYRFADLPMRFSHYYRSNIKEKTNIIKKLNNKHQKIVELICYCLMPNHFHLLVKQISENGVSTYLKNVENGYVRYFNTKYKRKGTLFESSFKSVRIEDDEQLVHVSRYIHLNPVSSHMCSAKDNKKFMWSSYSDYLSSKDSNFLDKSVIYNYFKNPKEYENFVLDNADYQRELQYIKKLVQE